jgi:uncharacterized protein YjbJ (UPF0337 family)
MLMALHLRQQSNLTFITEKENIMKPSMKDKLEGTLHEVKGKVKEVTGKVIDNPKLQGEGTGEKLAGKAQKKVGEFKKVVGK